MPTEERDTYGAMPTSRQQMYHRRRQRPAVWCLNFLCAVLLTLVLVAGVILFVLWLSLRPHRPKFFLADFVIPTANRQSGLVNLPVRFTVTEHNPNQKVGIYFESVHGSVYYGDRVVASGPVGAGSFFQPPKGDTPLLGQLTATGPVPADPDWPRFAAEAQAGSVALRMVLTSAVRFKVKLWDTRQHHVRVECDFSIAGDGTLQQPYKGSQCALSF